MEVLVKAFAPVIRETIIRAMTPVVDRLRFLETRSLKGERGEPGQNGFSLDDFDIRPCEDGRSIVLSFSQGDVTNEFELTFPVPVYRGVFKQGEAYVRGDVVTWGGCAWNCKEDTTEKPDSADHWELMVKKGRDGRDARG